MNKQNFKSGFKSGFFGVFFFLMIGTNWDATFCSEKTDRATGTLEEAQAWWCQQPSKGSFNMKKHHSEESDFFGPWQARKHLGRGNEQGEAIRSKLPSNKNANNAKESN